MKKITLAVSTLMLALTASAQAPKYVLFEHFTQASCGPCAAQNPGFQSTVLTPNPDKVRHIAIHTSWPGVDPMYNYNTAISGTRVTYYNITGVPTVVMLGNKKRGNPGAFSQTDVDNAFSEGSPIKVSVNDVDNGTTHTVTVNVLTVGTVPAATYKLRAAIVEDPIDFGSPPGNNGETHFPNVLRDMLPSTSGDPYTPASIGNTVSFTYNYTEDAAWNMTNIKVIAFVQNETTKEVLQCGTMNDPQINYTLGSPTPLASHGTTGNPSSFTMSSMNSGNATESFIYTLTTDMPGNWSANFSVNSTPYTSTATVSTAAGNTNNISINITPGATPYVGSATLTVASAANPNLPTMIKKVYVIANVTDLIINGSGGYGDGVTAGNASNFDSCYVHGLSVYTNEPGTAKTDDQVTSILIGSNAFTGVHNVYWNVGWTFPSLTDGVCANLQTFLNAGGCMFISGQDIGWETWDTQNSTYYTANTQAFFSNYMKATWASDGVATSNQLTAVTSDFVFGTVPSSNMNTSFYGSTYYYPDEINAGTGASVVFKYNNGVKNAGVRYTNGTFKTVYLAIGLEQLATPTTKYEILKWSHDWFYGLVSTEEFDHAMLSLGQNYPNPSNTATIIPMTNINNNMTLQIVDLQGRTVASQQVNKGTERIDVNTASLEAGMYMYRLMDGNTVVGTQRMQVIH